VPKFEPTAAETLRRLVAIRTDDCVEWRGQTGTGGYGTLWFNGRRTSTHRAAFEIASGDVIPAGLCIRHSCDNPPCVNPRHLLLGTSLDNAQDCVSRGRIARGENHYNAKLNEFDVLAIRNSREPLSVLSRQYGFSKMTIWRIKQGKSWAHIAMRPTTRQEQPVL
jgi:hypothetical protein